MNSPYAMKARYYTRKAWQHLGKAREFKRLANFEPYWDKDGIDASIRHCVNMARETMHTATIYRQIDGRL